ncbi:hypothetical protein AB0K74_32705, partial [Streptomyces sp. NPDC056159]|uniref:hypothetical protein n=1 Tax=Streptomyces sp. NPDC056159 TaxID=3155537 RepID=UPI003426EAE9
ADILYDSGKNASKGFLTGLASQQKGVETLAAAEGEGTCRDRSRPGDGRGRGRRRLDVPGV